MSPIVYVALAAWAISQLIKVLVAFVRIGRSESSRVVWRLAWAGGMPSSHSAITTSMLVMIALLEGTKSPIFGFAFVVTAIVLYDRAKLHHIYLVFIDRFPSLAAKVDKDPMLEDLVGHSIAEVLTGTAIGAAVAWIAWTLIAPP